MKQKYFILLISILLISSAIFAFSLTKSITGQMIAILTKKPYYADIFPSNINFENLTVVNISANNQPLIIKEPWTLFIANVTFRNYDYNEINPFVKASVFARKSLDNEILMAVAYLWKSCDLTFEDLVKSYYNKDVVVNASNKKFCVVNWIICEPSDVSCIIWDNSDYTLSKNEETSYYVFILFPHAVNNAFYNFRIDAGIE